MGGLLRRRWLRGGGILRLVNDDLIGAHVEERIEESVKGRLATTRCPFSKKRVVTN